MDMRRPAEGDLRELERDRIALEKIGEGGVLNQLHPHYPFVLMLPLLEAETPALVRLWSTRPQARLELVERWCAWARRSRYAWDECNKLREYMADEGIEIPSILRRYKKKSSRKGHPGPNRVLAEDLLILHFQNYLEGDGFDSNEAEIAIGLALDVNPKTVKEKCRRARKELEALGLSN